MAGASPSPGEEPAGAGRRTHVRIRLDLAKQVLANLPRRPAAVIRRSPPVLELIYEEQLAEEEKEELKNRLKELLGSGYEVEVEDRAI